MRTSVTPLAQSVRLREPLGANMSLDWLWLLEHCRVGDHVGKRLTPPRPQRSEKPDVARERIDDVKGQTSHAPRPPRTNDQIIPVGVDDAAHHLHAQHFLPDAL